MSPSFSVTLSAPTGGETPFTLKTQPAEPAAAYLPIWLTYVPNVGRRGAVVELSGRAGHVEGLESVVSREARLRRTEDRGGLAFDPDA